MSDDTNPDILELLLEDHEEFRQLFAEFERTEPERRKELFRSTMARLASHEAAEQAIVHATVRDEIRGAREVAEARLAEEASAERLLKDGADLDPSSEEFIESLMRLEIEVLTHAEHEERDEFPQLRDHLDEQRRAKLGIAFRTLRDNGPTRPHPRTPQTPEIRAAAGPIVGMLDRARDAARQAFER